MNTKFTTLALCFVILFASIHFIPATNAYLVPSGYPKRSILERDSHDKCNCTVVTATFEGVVTGIVTFAQDPSGSTLITGLFSQGLVDPDKYQYNYLIVDSCGKVLRNLTCDLNVTYSNGGTLPFSVRLYDFNLDCDSNGVLRPSGYHKKVKRQSTTSMSVTGGSSNANAPLTSV